MSTTASNLYHRQTKDDLAEAATQASPRYCKAPTGIQSPNNKYISALKKIYPEYDAGGFSRDDEHITFYSRVNSLISEDTMLLDFGAGRGKLADDPDNYKRRLRIFKGRCKKVIGADVDPAVQVNPIIDEAYVIKAGEPLPFDDETFDVILSWAVWEHVDDPEWCARELRRVLKPGGWICSWTPNKWGYVALGARMIPEKFHTRILETLFRNVVKADKFPTAYKMNTFLVLRRLFPQAQFRNCSYAFSGEPRYHAGSSLFARLIRVYNSLMPASGKCYLHVFLQKKRLPDI